MYYVGIYPIDNVTSAQALAFEQAIEEAMGRTWDETEESANALACYYRIYCPTESEALQVAEKIRGIPHVRHVSVACNQEN